MYKALPIIKDAALAERLRSLHIWGGASGFEISETLCETGENYDLYAKYEVIIADKESGLELLRRGTAARYNLRVVLCGTEGDFESARLGIVYNAYDYIVEPFDAAQLLAMLNRAKNELNVNSASDILVVEQLAEYFDSGDNGYYEFLNVQLGKINSGSKDAAEASERLKVIYEQLWEEISLKYQWIDLYISNEIFKQADSAVPEDSFRSTAEKLTELFSIFRDLYPPHNEQLEQVISVILTYPENDLRQKTLSHELHINCTYLSTIFLAQTGVRFVDYVGNIKLRRAAWLLLNTRLGITEIAQRLDYKDKSYFSKLFKIKYGVTPSEYRIPINYDFQI